MLQKICSTSRQHPLQKFLFGGSYLLSNSAATFWHIDFTGHHLKKFREINNSFYCHANQAPLSGEAVHKIVEFSVHSEDQNGILFCFCDSSLRVFLSVCSLSLRRGVQAMIRRGIVTVIDCRWRNPRSVLSCSPPSQWSTDSWRDLLSAAPLQPML